MTQPPPVLHEMSNPEQIALIYRIRVWYPRMRSIYDEIVRAYEMNPLTPDPECIALFGPFRTGKTTIVDSFCELHPRIIHKHSTEVPILKAIIPAKATVPNLLVAMLSALGDPLADRGSIGVKQNRLENLITDCNVKMIILDEANHFVDRDSERVLHDVSNTMKNLIKFKNIACVLVGLPYTEEVLKANEQFGSLFGDPHTLAPFRWDDNEPGTIDEFRRFLREVEHQLPVPSCSFLASKEVAWRCFVATQGKVGFIMRLLRRSAEEAVRQDAPSLSHELLREAFSRTLAGKRRGLANPFVGEVPQTAGPEEAEYWPAGRRRRSA